MKSSNIKSSIDEYVKGMSDDAVHDLISEMSTNHLSLLDIVENLEDELTSQDVSSRSRGIKLLVEILRRMDVNTVNSEQIKFILNFLCERIDDHYSITPHLVLGISTLISFGELSNESVNNISKILSNKLHVQSLTQSVRRDIYNIYHSLLTNYLPNVKNLSTEFAYGFIQAMDGEKDPRNLIIAFQCVQIISQNFNITVYSEELFEVFSCYFPIDFNPPPNDQFGITKKSLVDSLCKCFSSSSKFAEYALPLLLEKLSSNVESAKHDSLEIITNAAEVYGCNAMQEYSRSLWCSIKSEVFSGNMTQSVESLPYMALSSVCRGLLNTDNDLNHLEEFIKESFRDIEQHLSDSGLRLITPTSKLIETLASSSSHAFRIINGLVFEKVIKNADNYAHLNEKSLVTSLLLKLYKLSAKNNLPQESCSIFYQNGEFLYSMFTALFTSYEQKYFNQGLEGYSILLKLNYSLSADKLVALSSRLFNFFSKNSLEDFSNAYDVISYLSSKNQKLVENTILDPILNSYEFIPLSKDSNQLVDCLIAVCNNPNFIPKTCENLTTRLVSVISSKDSSITEDSFQITSKAISSVISLDTISNNESSNSTEVENFFASHLLYKLLECCQLLVDDSKFSNSQYKFITHIAEPINSIFQKYRSLNKISVLKHQLIDSFLSHSVPLFFKEISSERAQVTEDNHYYLLPVFIQIFFSHNSSLTFEYSSSVVNYAVNIILSDGIKLHAVKETAAVVIFATLNRLEKKSLNDIIESIKSQIKSQLVSTGNHFRACFTLWVWLTKAAAINCSSKLDEFLKLIIETLDVTSPNETPREDQAAYLAANSFNVLLEEFAANLYIGTINPFYKQKIVSLCLPKLLKTIKNSTFSSEKQNIYCTTLATLMSYTPKATLCHNLNDLLSALVKCLDCDEFKVQVCGVDALSDLIEVKRPEIYQFLDEIIPRLLLMSTNSLFVKARCRSLHCISLLSKFPSDIIYPHHPTVIRKLADCLNDHKRLVRQEAAKARNAWFLAETIKK